jgi:hypothetical protein
MVETKVIENNGVKITVIYEIVDEDVFNSLVDEMDDENLDGHPFKDGPASLSDVKNYYDEWKDRVAYPETIFSLTKVYAIQEACRRRLKKYKSGFVKPNPVYLLYEELLPFFKDCYVDVNDRIQDHGGYLIYNVIDRNYEEFLEVVRLGHQGRMIEAFKLMEEIFDSFLIEWQERYFK